MGSLLMLSYPILFWKLSTSESRKDRLLAWILILISVVLHILTGSRATLLAAIFGAVVWLVARKRTTLLLMVSSVLGTLILAGFVLLGPDNLKPESLKRGAHSSGITDLTGRTELWMGSLFLINQRPLTGYGFAVEGRIWRDRRYQEPEITLWSGSAKTSLHNGYLGIAVGLGWFGLVLWLLITLTPICRLLSLKLDRHVALVFATVSMCLLVNFVEAAVSGSRSITALAFWIMWVVALRLREQNLNLANSETV
jgi:O-antigen ligase